MKLPTAHLHTPAPAAVAVPRPSHGAQVAGWTLHLHRAEASLVRLPASAGAGEPRDRQERQLESCGVPALAGEPPPRRADIVPARAPAAEEPVPPHHGKEREVERAPIRLHLQSLPAQGIRLWLGIDGDVALVAQRASAAVADLRRNLQPTAGERIASIVCNGVVVYPRAPSSAAPPARTPTSFLKDPP